MRYIQRLHVMLGLPCHVGLHVHDSRRTMSQLTFEEMPVMLLQGRRKLLNVRWPYIISVIHEWRVKDMSSSPCPIEVNEAYLRGVPHIPVP